MSGELFDLPDSLSPRLAWLRRHNLHLIQMPNGRWEISLNGENFSRGDTADEACFKFCEKTRLPLWDSPA